jgi:hypothetical protein
LPVPRWHLPLIGHEGATWTHAHLRTDRTPRRSGAPRRRRFAPSETDAPQATSPTIALRTRGGINALIALQGVQDPGERRRRAIERGRRALDALDELKLACSAAASTRQCACG